MRVWGYVGVFGGVDMRSRACMSVCEFVLVLVSMPISVPLSISADTSVDGVFVRVDGGVVRFRCGRWLRTDYTLTTEF